MIPLVIAIYKASEAQNFEMLEVSAPAYESRQQSVANYFTVELTVLQETAQELADLFSLTLPVSLKK